MKRGGRIDVVSPDVWGSPGGIARVAVAVAAACESAGFAVTVHGLHDPVSATGAINRAATERAATGAINRAATERAATGAINRAATERAATGAINRAATERATTERAATERAATERAATERAAAVVRGYGGDRRRMSAAVLRAGLEGSLVIFMHPNLAVLGPLFALAGSLASPGLLRSRWRSKYVVVSHGVEVWSPLSRARMLGMRQATAHWAVSENTRWYLGEVQGIPKERVRVIHNALGPGAVLPVLEAGRGRGDYLLVVSRLHPDDAYKGVDLVIEAAAGRWPVVVAGDGPDRARLEAVARARGGDVRFMGRVDEATLQGLFAGARAFVLPSAGEGFGLVYLEAMAHGLPCVAARAGGAPEVVLDGVTGVVVRPRDVEALRVAIGRVWGEEGVAMGLSGRARLEREFLFSRYERDVHAALAAL